MRDLQQLKQVIAPGKEPIRHICHKWSTCDSPFLFFKEHILKNAFPESGKEQSHVAPNILKGSSLTKAETKPGLQFKLPSTSTNFEMFWCKIYVSLTALFYKSPSQVGIQFDLKIRKQMLSVRKQEPRCVNTLSPFSIWNRALSFLLDSSKLSSSFWKMGRPQEQIRELMKGKGWLISFCRIFTEAKKR